MTRIGALAVVGSSLFWLTQLTAAAAEDVVGTWDVRWSTSGRGGGVQLALLEVFSDGSATLSGSPIDLRTDGENLSFDYDSSSSGRTNTLRFSGRVEGDAIEGEVVLQGDQRRPWTATRVGANPGPVDFSGVWVGRNALGGGGWRPQDWKLTAEGAARAEQMTEFDDSALRCMPVGLGQLFAWPYLLEIVQAENAELIVFLYEGEREVRRVYMDGREHPDTGGAFDGPMGYSTGRLEGRTLEIETTNLTPALLDNALELHHMGSQTRVTETYTLSDDGRFLRAELILEDPLTLQAPIRRRRILERTDEEVAPYHCDPYSFFRQLHEQGEIDEFFEHEMVLER